MNLRWVCPVAILIAGGAAVLAASNRHLPLPLPAHPGNVFLASEPVGLRLPAGGATNWCLVDDGGSVVQNGRVTGERVELGRLGVGWYELVRGEAAAPFSNRVSLAVLAPLRVPASAASPIGLDVAMAWFYPPDQMPAAASLCALAGVNWVRDRLSWPEMEPERGRFARTNRYDVSAAAQVAAGLRHLQVIHQSPAWAGSNTARFPLDLRDAFRFYRAIAQRWQGQTLAFEPWNEADIENFGGHTGSEIASLQKAGYLGLKAGNPKIIVCQNVFAVNRRATLDEFDANEAWPYFETLNLHHYVAFDAYPQWYAPFRAISAGRPLWVTECSLPVKWTGDPQSKEPTTNDLRIQAERVAKVFACALHEGATEVFYFLLPHYVEGQTQFGIVRPDLTPRPAYVALAAVGRLLADAQPAGRLRPEDESIRAFAFRARPGGEKRTVLVAWTTNATAELQLSCAPEAVFNHLGQSQSAGRYNVGLTGAPLFVVLPANRMLRAVAIEPPPKPSAVRAERPCPLVLQALWPEKEVELDQSAYRIVAGQERILPLRLYNFGSRKAEVRLHLQLPPSWEGDLPSVISLAPDADCDVPLRLRPAADSSRPGVTRIRVEADAGSLGRATLAVNLYPRAP